MRIESEILEPVRRQLEELLGQSVSVRKVEHQDLEVDAVFQSSSNVFVVDAKASNRIASIRSACEQARYFAERYGSNSVPLVAVPFMGPSGREVCLEAGVSFVDVAGNAHLEAPGLLVHVEGKKQLSPERGRPLSVFAPRSSRVARLMLIDPKRWWQQSELAAKAGIGRGFVSRITGRLKEDKLIEADESGKIRPSDPNLMLDAWKDEYEFEKHRIIAGHVASRSGEELAAKCAEVAKLHGVKYAFTGLPAAAKLAPFAGFRLAAMYVHELPAEDFLKAMSFHGGEQGANAWIILPADDGVFEGAREIDGQQCVCEVQAYLDLGGMPERASEAAQHLREKCLKWR